MSRPVRVAFQGAPGAFSEAAALELWPNAEPIGLDTFEAVVRAVSGGEVDAGILPVENRIAGPVVEAAAALRRAPDIDSGREIVLPIRLHLVGRAGARSDRIRRIGGHPVALAQCSRFLGSRHDVVIEEWLDSALACQAVSISNDSEFAAIAGDRAARRYGLQTLDLDIQDQAENFTRFVELRRRP